MKNFKNCDLYGSPLTFFQIPPPQYFLTRRLSIFGDLLNTFVYFLKCVIICTDHYAIRYICSFFLYFFILAVILVFIAYASPYLIICFVYPILNTAYFYTYVFYPMSRDYLNYVKLSTEYSRKIRSFILLR